METQTLKEPIESLDPKTHNALREALIAQYCGITGDKGAIVKDIRDIKQKKENLLDQHWIYRVWSRLVDAEVWFAHCNRLVSQAMSHFLYYF